MELVYEFIYAVQKYGTFTGGAKHLHISQPALSIAIKKFEIELTFPIFNRDTTPITLTPAGEIIFNHIEQIKMLETNMHSKLNDLKNITTGTLRIGATQYFTAFILPSIISKYKEIYPLVNVEFVESNSVNLSDLLLENKIDLMFSVKSFEISKFTSFSCLTDYLYIAIPKNYIKSSFVKGHCLSRQDILSNTFDELKSIPNIKDLKRTPFILLKNGNNLYDRNKVIFELEGISPPIAMHIDQLTTAHYLCKNGMGATFTTGKLIKAIDDNNNLSYLKLNHPLMTRDFKIVLNKNKYISKIIKSFINIFE